MRSPIFLILFTLFSLLSFGVTAIAQETGLPVVQGTYQSASSPAKRALEEAKAAKEAAENEKNEAQVALEAATEALNIAEQQLQAAQEAADAEDQALQVAQAEVDKAQQAVDDAMSELNEAQAALDALNQQLAEAQNKVDERATIKASAEQALQAALAEISRITGLPAVGGNYGTSPIPPVDGTYSGPPGGDINPLSLKVTSYECSGSEGNGPEELVDGRINTQYTCNGPLKVEFTLAKKENIQGVVINYANSPRRFQPEFEIRVDGKVVTTGQLPYDEACAPAEGKTVTTDTRWTSNGFCSSASQHEFMFEPIIGQIITYESLATPSAEDIQIYKVRGYHTVPVPNSMTQITLVGGR